MTEIIEIAVNKIKPDPNQPREKFDEEEIKNSAESVKVHGFINKIEVDEIPGKDGKHMIITGECRWRAAKIAKLKTIPCELIDGYTKNEKEKMNRLARQLAENFARQNMNLSDKKVRKRLRTLFNYLKRATPPLVDKLGRKHIPNVQGKLSKMVGKSQTWTSQVLGIDTALETIKRAVNEEKLSVSSAHEIMKLKDKKDQGKYLEKVMKEKPEHRKIREEVAQIKEAEPEIKEAILKEEITPKQASRINKLKTLEQRKKAVHEHKMIDKIEKNIEKNIEVIETAKEKRKKDKSLIQAKAWIASFEGSVVDSRRQLEKTIKILLVATTFIPMMDEKQLQKLNHKLEDFIAILERAEQLAEQIQEKIK